MKYDITVPVIVEGMTEEERPSNAIHYMTHVRSILSRRITDPVMLPAPHRVDHMNLFVTVEADTDDEALHFFKNFVGVVNNVVSNCPATNVSVCKVAQNDPLIHESKTVAEMCGFSAPAVDDLQAYMAVGAMIRKVLGE